MATGNTVVDAAYSQLDKPYQWDRPLLATDPNPASFDCSGLTMWCYHKVGVTLSHEASAQYHELKHVPVQNAPVGALLFYRSGFIHHVAINVGNGQLIEAPQPGTPVRVRNWHPGDSELMAKAGYSPKVSGIFSGASGGGSTTGLPTTPAPYDPASLHVPLTAAQRAAMIRYIDKVNKKNKVGTLPPGFLAGEKDDALINLYTEVWKQDHGQGPTPGFKIPGTGVLNDVGSFLGILTSASTWERVAMVAVGGVLVAVAVGSIVKGKR